MPRRRGMSSEHASEVKVSGHTNERYFASLIGGDVIGDSSMKKADVVDALCYYHSVKSRTVAQIFSYRRDRLVSDSSLPGMGYIAKIMVACLDAFPENRDDYSRDKAAEKSRLAIQMRLLREALSEPRQLRAFLAWAIFNVDEVDFLSILASSDCSETDFNGFHIFDKNDVANALVAQLVTRNSQAQHARQTDDQKVTFKPRTYSRNIGELEVRTDSGIHYREMRLRLYVSDLCGVLQESIPLAKEESNQLRVYGSAVRKFRVLKEGEEIWYF